MQIDKLFVLRDAVDFSGRSQGLVVVLVGICRGGHGEPWR